ncbi:hypothetical protein PR003_g24997 [Phytophthora rubi]|nr:hypothetical protein PR003_g24997 [Phytophthora rubi]
MSDVTRLLALVEEYLPLGKDEWERLTVAYNTTRSRGWVERDLDSLRRKFKTLYSARKPTGTAEMPPHIKKSKLLKLAIDDKANVIEMDDDADEDQVEGRFVEPDFSFDPNEELFDDREGDGGPPMAGSDAASSSNMFHNDIAERGVSTRNYEVGSELTSETIQPPLYCETQDTFDPSLDVDGLEAFASTPKPAPLPASTASRRLRSACLKNSRKVATPDVPGSDSKPAAARVLQAGSADDQEIQRYKELRSYSNRLGGSDLYEFRDSVLAKRAREEDDNEQVEAGYVKAKRVRATMTATTLKKKLVNLESSSTKMGESVFEMMMLFHEENERKAEARRADEDQRRRDECSAREARLQAEKAEAEERRRHEKLEMEERARRDKEEARARTQELLLLIGTMFKKA